MGKIIKHSMIFLICFTFGSTLTMDPDTGDVSMLQAYQHIFCPFPRDVQKKLLTQYKTTYGPAFEDQLKEDEALGWRNRNVLNFLAQDCYRYVHGKKGCWRFTLNKKITSARPHKRNSYHVRHLEASTDPAINSEIRNKLTQKYKIHLMPHNKDTPKLLCLLISQLQTDPLLAQHLHSFKIKKNSNL